MLISRASPVRVPEVLYGNQKLGANKDTANNDRGDSHTKNNKLAHQRNLTSAEKQRGRSDQCGHGFGQMLLAPIQL